MDSGFYTSATGMLDQFNVENNIADNLANLQTPGYKERSAVLQEFSQVLDSTEQGLGSGVVGASQEIGRLAGPPAIQSYGLNLAQGSPRYTGSPQDMMVVGNGFFTVRSGNQTLLTRNGSFRRAANGTLTTSEGYAVLDAAGKPISLPRGTVSVGRDGALSVDGRQVARLAITGVAVGTVLKQAGSGYYVRPANAAPARPQGMAVMQGYLEGSNVDMAGQTSAMIAAQRAYQADSKMMQIQDDTMGLAVNDLGKVS